MLERVGFHVPLDGRGHINLSEQLLDAVDALEPIRDDQPLPSRQGRHRTGVGQQRGRSR